MIFSRKSRNTTEKAFVNDPSRREEYEYCNIYSFISCSVEVI